MTKLRTLLREPLLHFLLIGALLFVVFGLKQGPATQSSNRIVVDAGQIEQLAAQFQRTWMRPPTPKELDGLIESLVRDEIYYREALALGLDKDDPVMRRRMRQKLEFIFEDLTAETPTEAQLSEYLQDNADYFRIEPRVTFQQLYLNPDDRADPAGDARRLLTSLQDDGADPATAGDPSLLPFEMTLASTSEIARNFGREFAEELSRMPPGDWQGPVQSGLGTHVIRVLDREEGRLPDLAEVRPLVEREWLANRREELRDLSYNRLREGYEVVVESPGGGEEGDSGPAAAQAGSGSGAPAGTQASQ
jgi:hypothetical protein